MGTRINKNPAVAEEYRSGKEFVLQFLVVQGMKFPGGKTNPFLLQRMLKEKFGK